VQKEAHQAAQSAVDRDAPQYGTGGEGEPRIEEEDQPGEMNTRQRPGGEAAPEDREPAPRQTMKIGRSSF
jgi:hypothetical protein